MIRGKLLSSAVIVSTVSYYTSNLISYFSLSTETNRIKITCVFIRLLILNLFIPLLFFEHGNLAKYLDPINKILDGCFNIPLEETMSQILYLGLGFYFMLKKG